MAQGELQIEHTPIFTKNLEAFQDPNIRFIINQGGSRSSKSYSILQLLIYVALTTPNTSISVVRKYFPSLRTSIYRDFVDIMKDLNLYHENLHNMTAHRYDFPNGSTIEFFATIDEQKLRGKKRTHLFCNEANEISFEEYMQLVMRTSGKVFIDFNPSESDHWIYDLANTDTKAILIRSTYLDNTFLGQDQIDYIANMINVDENYYRIYALGIAPTGTTRIYSHFKSYTGDPGTMIDHCYGLDFGFNHPSVLMKISYNETGGIYIKEEFYKSNLIISELITLIRESCDDKTIYCDSARPEIIEELRRSGLNARGSDKNVKVGIDTVKSSQIYMDEKAVNAWKEYRQYSWKTNGNHILDEPVKLNDDAMDACFIGETLIDTINGKVRIDEIKVGDLVLTTKGYKRVYKTHNNGLKRVKKYRMKGDTFNIYISSTEEHKIKSNEKWIQISQLQSGMTLTLNKHSIEESINYIPEGDTSHNIDGQCIEKYGNSIMDRSQRDMIYIIKMRILGIIDQKILNVLKNLNIYHNIVRKGLRKIQSSLEYFGKLVLNQLNSGTPQKKELNGTPHTESKVGKIENISQKFVKSVVKNIKQDAQEDQDSAIIIVKLNQVEEIENKSLEYQIVYDISVEDQPEYFANGILVHNCRYAIHTHKKKTNVEKPGIHTFKPQGMPKIYNGFTNQVGRSNDWWNKED